MDQLKKVLLLLLIQVLSFQVMSQPFLDIANIKYQKFPEVMYSGEEGKRVRIDQITGNLTLPIPLKNDNLIITGGTYDQLSFVSSAQDARILYAVNLQFGYLKKWKGDEWESLVIALPKISSDKLAITGDAFQMGGVFLLSYKKKENLKYKFGLYYNREFFGNFFMPLVGLDWKPMSRLNVFGVLPGSMNLEYKLNKKLYTGISYQCITASYRLHEGNEKLYVRNGDSFWGHNQIRVFVNYYIGKYLVLFAEAGHTKWRKFETYRAGKVKTDHSLFNKTRDGMLVNAGVAFRIRLSE